MTFTITVATWPAVVTIAQRTSFSTRVQITYRTGEVRLTDTECGWCLRRFTDTYVVRDQFAWQLRHVDCFHEELSERRATGEWRLVTMEWNA